jgi:hypothetical protein
MWMIGEGQRLETKWAEEWGLESLSAGHDLTSTKSYTVLEVKKAGWQNSFE